MSRSGDLGDEEAGLRPERLGERLRLRPERLGAGAATGRAAAASGEGWTHDEAGATAGRMYRFESAAEMQDFVAELQETLDRGAARRGGADGPVTLLVFLAAHRMSSD